MRTALLFCIISFLFSNTNPPTTQSSNHTAISSHASVLYTDAAERILKGFISNELKNLNANTQIKCLNEDGHLVAVHTLSEILASALYSRCLDIRKRQLTVTALRKLTDAAIEELTKIVQTKLKGAALKKLTYIVQTELTDAALKELIDMTQTELTDTALKELICVVQVAQLHNLLMLLEKCGSHICWRNQLTLMPELIRSYALVHSTCIPQEDASQYLLQLKSVMSSVDMLTIKKEEEQYLKNLQGLVIPEKTALRVYQCAHDNIKLRYAIASTLGLARFFHELLLKDKHQKSVVALLEEHTWIMDQLFDRFALPMLQQGGEANKNPHTLLEQWPSSQYRKEHYKDIKSARNTIAPLLFAAKAPSKRQSPFAQIMWGNLLEKLTLQHCPVETIASQATETGQPIGTDAWSQYNAKLASKRRARQGISFEHLPELKIMPCEGRYA